MWHELLQIKTSREQRAQSALAQRRAEQAKAHLHWQASVERLSQHRHFADEQERVLFLGLLQRHVRLRDIETMQQTLALLKTQDHQLDSECDQAQASHVDAERHTASALEVQRVAGRVKEKFTQLAAHHRAAGDDDIQRAEELEQEEVGALRWHHTDVSLRDAA